MKSSEASAEARRIVDELLHLLSEGEIARKIEGPIEEAVQEFQVEPRGEVSHSFFHETISRFVQHIYRHGVPCPRELTLEQARDKAISLLSRRYRGDHYRGYEAAYEDATCEDTNGLRVVLSRMADIIKEDERSSYMQWVFRTGLDPRQRELPEQVARILLDRNAPFLPEKILQMDLAELSDCWQELVLFDIKTDDLLRQACARPTYY
jgi:hypothetical protein